MQIVNAFWIIVFTKAQHDARFMEILSRMILFLWKKTKRLQIADESITSCSGFFRRKHFRQKHFRQMRQTSFTLDDCDSDCDSESDITKMFGFLCDFHWS